VCPYSFPAAAASLSKEIIIFLAEAAASIAKGVTSSISTAAAPFIMEPLYSIGTAAAFLTKDISTWRPIHNLSSSGRHRLSTHKGGLASRFLLV
jgi:hypothetical protein